MKPEDIAFVRHEALFGPLGTYEADTFLSHRLDKGAFLPEKKRLTLERRAFVTDRKCVSPSARVIYTGVGQVPR